jgi:hypothetical protein
MSGCDNSNIRKNYIVSGVEIDILSACTGFYTNNIYNCSGDTIFIDPAFLDANTVIADTLSACTAIYTSNLYGCSPINVNDELYILSGLFLSGTPTTNTAIDVLVRDTNGEVKIRDIDSIISGITTSANTYVTGTTFSPNQAVLTRNDGANVFKLSGGSNVTLTNPSTNQILIDVSIPPGSNTFVTGFTYDDINTFRVSQNDNTFFDATINILSGVTYYGDGSGLTNIPVSGVTNLQTELNNKVENGDNLGGGNEVFKNKSGTTLNFRTLSGGSNTTLTTIGDTIRIDVSIPPDTNTFVTGGTYNESNDTITLTRNDAVTITITGVTDYFTTGGTYNLTTQNIDFVGNSAETTFSVDLSALVNNVTGDTFLTAFTYDNANTFTIVRNDNQTFKATINSVTGLTINGDLNVTGTTNLDVVNGNIFSGGTYYGDGSNLSGITTVDNYTTGATLVGDTLVFDRTDIVSAYTVSLSTLIVTGTTTNELFLGDEEFITNTAGRSVLTTTSTGFLSFAGAGQPDDAGVSFKIPLDYDSEPQFAVQWTMDGTSSTANTVNYNLNITTGRTTTINEHTVVSETVSIVDEAYSGTAWRILQTPFSSSTLNYSAGDYIHVELERDPGNVNDTMNDTAYVSGLIFKYKANK